MGVWQSLVVIPILGEDEAHLYIEEAPSTENSKTYGYIRKGSNQVKSKRREAKIDFSCFNNDYQDNSSARRWTAAKRQVDKTESG